MQGAARIAAVSVLGAALVGGCRTPATLVGTSWPEADRLFRQSPTWRGGDGGYTVRLGPGRTLWLFADSFVGPGPGRSRADRKFVHNSIGIETGDDPAAARMRFFHGEAHGSPSAFFADRVAHRWLWPGPGVRLGRGLLLTFVRERRAKGGLGFRTTGSEAVLVPNPDASPEAWRRIETPIPRAPPGVRFGTGAFLAEGGDLYAFVAIEPGRRHDVYVARWPRAQIERTLLSGPRWWDGKGWTPDPSRAVAIVRDLQTQFSVEYVPRLRRFVMISVGGFGRTSIVARLAPRPQGPWSAPHTVLRPPESVSGRVDFVYSAIAHRLKDGCLVVTYCTNDLDLWKMAADMRVYFPRFVRLTGSTGGSIRCSSSASRSSPRSRR